MRAMRIFEVRDRGGDFLPPSMDIIHGGDARRPSPSRAMFSQLGILPLSIRQNAKTDGTILSRTQLKRLLACSQRDGAQRLSNQGVTDQPSTFTVLFRKSTVQPLLYTFSLLWKLLLVQRLSDTHSSCIAQRVTLQNFLRYMDRYTRCL